MRELILECDKPSEHTGRIYPIEEVRKAIEVVGDKPLFGEQDQPDYLEVDLSKAVIKTTDLELVGTELYGETVAIEGKEVVWDNYRGSIRATGKIDSDGKVSELKLFGVDLIKEQIVEEMAEDLSKTG